MEKAKKLLTGIGLLMEGIWRGPGGLRSFFLLCTGRFSEVFRPERGPTLYTAGPAVSPDGHYLLYAQTGQSGSNIMMVDPLR